MLHYLDILVVLFLSLFFSNLASMQIPKRNEERGKGGRT